MIDAVNREIGDAVKAALKEKGMTQAQLAKQLGMEPTNLSTLLAGRNSGVPKRWQEILEAVGLKLSTEKK